MHRPRTLAALAAAAVALAVPAAASPPRPSGSVSFLAGEAWRTSGAGRHRLRVGSPVHPADVLETLGRTRLEILLPDGSVVRLGPRSRLELVGAAFDPRAAGRKVTAALAVGSLWAKVAKAVGGDSTFEVRTSNAVAGVRGTTFRVDARRDRSCVVKVYSGAVAVAGGGALPRLEHAPGERREVPGPSEVTRAEWERIVGRMMQISVAPDGTPGEPEAFALAAPGADAWEEWNRERDGAGE